MADEYNGRIGGWDIRSADDLRDVTLPPGMGSGPKAPTGMKNDTTAQKQAAAKLAYSMHGGKCQVCGAAESEAQLCSVGRQLYGLMRAVGAVE